MIPIDDFRRRILKPVTQAGSNDLVTAVADAVKHEGLQARVDMRYVKAHMRTRHTDQTSQNHYRQQSGAILHDLYARACEPYCALCLVLN